MIKTFMLIPPQSEAPPESSDVTSSGLTHYSNCRYGPASNISDDNTSDYVQGLTYIAIDLGSGVTKTLTGFRLFIFDYYECVSGMQGSVLQGSNDSSNGTDGSWDTLHTIQSAEMVQGGWCTEISLSGSEYRWYRLSGLGGTNNNSVIKEWELLGY